MSQRRVGDSFFIRAESNLLRIQRGTEIFSSKTGATNFCYLDLDILDRKYLDSLDRKDLYSLDRKDLDSLDRKDLNSLDRKDLDSLDRKDLDSYR